MGINKPKKLENNPFFNSFFTFLLVGLQDTFRFLGKVKILVGQYQYLAKD